MHMSNISWESKTNSKKINPVAKLMQPVANLPQNSNFSFAFIPNMDVVETEQNAEAAAGLDKEERKRKKKERRLAEKRAKAKSDA
jgi:hypothetical protein